VKMVAWQGGYLLSLKPKGKKTYGSECHERSDCV